jgi:hypothetical protein
VYIDRRVASKGAAAPRAPEAEKSSRGLPAIPSAAVLAPTTTAAAAAALRLGTRFVHVQSTASHLRSVQRRDGPLRFFRIRHLNKSETTRTSRFAIRHDADPVYLSITFEQLPQLVFSSVEIQISYENVFQRNASVVKLFECGLTSAGKQVLLSLENI